MFVYVSFSLCVFPLPRDEYLLVVVLLWDRYPKVALKSLCASACLNSVSFISMQLQFSGGVRVRFRVRFQVVNVPIFGEFWLGNPTKKATASKLFSWKSLCPSTVRMGFWVRSRRLSEYGSVAYLAERPTRETQAEQYSDTTLVFKCHKIQFGSQLLFSSFNSDASFAASLLHKSMVFRLRPNKECMLP